VGHAKARSEMACENDAAKPSDTGGMRPCTKLVRYA
jgi:hypothetical protein